MDRQQAAALDRWIEREPCTVPDMHVPFEAVSPEPGVWEVIDVRDGGEDAPALVSWSGIAEESARSLAEAEARRRNELLPVCTASPTVRCLVCGYGGEPEVDIAN